MATATKVTEYQASVYELLNHLELPDFGEHNWQSSIRHHVRLHDKYKDLSRWSGNERSDIMYEDEKTQLLNLLRDKNYLPYIFGMDELLECNHQE